MTQSQRTAESLGKPIYQQQSSRSNLIAGIILSLLMVGGAAGLIWYAAREVWRTRGQLPWWVERGFSWGAVGISGAIALALLIGGVCLFIWSRSMFSFRLYVCGDGFYFSKSGKVTVFAFDEIAKVEETIIHERLPIVKGAARHLMPAKTSRSYRVRRSDGEQFVFNANVIPRTSLLAGPLATAAKERNIPWTTQEKTA
jgi:hypothetical protein